jgi:hypothetical protein
MGARGYLPWSKARPGRDADHTSSFSAEVMIEYELYLLSPYAFVASCGTPILPKIRNMYMYIYTKILAGTRRHVGMHFDVRGHTVCGHCLTEWQM